MSPTPFKYLAIISAGETAMIDEPKLRTGWGVKHHAWSKKLRADIFVNRCTGGGDNFEGGGGDDTTNTTP